MRRLDRFQQSHLLLAFPFAVLQKFGNDQAGAFAARIAYSGLFALFPLLLLLTTALGFILAHDPTLRERVIHSAVGQFPIIGSELKVGHATLKGSGVALAVGVIGTVWGTLGVGETLESAMNTVWNIPYVSWPNLVFRHVRSAGLLLTLGLAAFVSAGLATFASKVASGVSVPLAFLGAVAINLIIFELAFMVLTAEPLTWKDVLLGALVATFFWQVLQALTGWFVTRELKGYSNTYGFFAVVLVLLSWMYLAAQLTLLAVEINVVHKYRLWPRSMTQPPLIEGDRRVFTRLAQFEVRRPEYEVRIRFRDEADGDPQMRSSAGAPRPRSEQDGG